MSSLAAAVAGAGGDAVALADLYAGLGVVGGGSTHALLDLPSHGQESLLDIAGVLGRGLEEGDAQAVGELLWNAVSKVGLIAIGTASTCDDVFAQPS